MPLLPEAITIDPITITPSCLDPHHLDADAVRSLQRLKARGYQAYLVGGCVRDLLLERFPKDFDIATEARPQQVKRAFPRNCRIIGRRFKLAHLHFQANQKILEVATFRSSPPPSLDEESEGDDPDLLIVQDNEFGTMEEDALRRDFTVNALFFDPLADEIIDFVGGMADVEAKMIRTIGEPLVRFREDPVRILRAAKFAGRLGFHLDGPTEAAMRAVATDLSRAAMPRILEEIQRLLRGGHALPSFQILRDVGALAVLLPVVHDYLESAAEDERLLFWRTLETLDNRIHSGRTPSNAVLLGGLFLRPILHRSAGAEGRSPATLAEEVVGPIAIELRLPRRDAGALKRICSVQNRFTATGKRRFRLASFVRDPHIEEALELFEMTCTASGEHFEELERWRALVAGRSPDEAAPEAPAGIRPAVDAAPRSRESVQGGGERGGSRHHGDRERPRREPTREERPRRDAPRTRDERRKGKSRRPERQHNRDKQRGPDRPERSPREADTVQTIEPEAFDLSAFDIELAPREVPSFDSFVEHRSQTKKRKQPQSTEDDSYRPPPPPGQEDAPPPPPPSDDVFGDW